MSQKHAYLVDYSKSAQELWQLTLFSESETNHKEMYRVCMSQLTQQILQVPAPWSVWNRDRLRNARKLGHGDRLYCPYSHLNIVARVSPLFEGGLQNVAVIQAWYAQFRGPNMPSFDRVREAVEGLTDDDIERLVSFRCLGYAWAQLCPFASGPGGWGPVSTQSSYHDLRLFTTHNGRLGFSLCEIEEGSEIERFSGSDVALTIDKHQSLVARVFIINSGRSRNGYVPIQDLSYRYAIPDAEDTIAKCERVRDADLGEGKTVDAVRSSSIVPNVFTIDQLQFWTW